MSQTDRQTDKGMVWSITSFDEDEMAKLEDAKHFPEWVRTVAGGREACPDTARVHFQGYLQCHRQVRFSQVKGWLPKAHIEVARNASKLFKYAMKKDTAIEDKEVHKNVLVHYRADEVCMEIAKRTLHKYLTDDPSTVKTPKELYVIGINDWLLEKPEMMGQLMNPSLKNAFADTAPTWYTLALREGIAEADRLAQECEAESQDEAEDWEPGFKGEGAL